MAADILQGGLGPDRFDGGGQPNDGIGDSVSYHRATGAVNVSLVTGRGDLGEATGDTLINIENLIGSDYDDTLTGDGGDNILLGGAGDDLLDGGPGADLLIGGAGRDTVSYQRAYSTHGVRVDLALGVADGSAAQGDRLAGIENLTGSWQDDELYGDDAANRLHGEAGDDRLAGRGGADVFVSYHDGGHDTVLDFDLERDRLELHLYDTNLDWRSLAIAADGADTVIGVGERASLTLQDVSPDELAAQHFVLVREVRPMPPQVTDDTDDTDDSPPSLTLEGTAGDDTLVGTDGDDILIGKGGADTLMGKGGNDLLEGGAGADTLDGGADTDTASYASSAAAVTVDLSGTKDGNGYITGTGGDAAGDKLKNIENLTGSAYGDTLTGDDNANTLTGGAGDDALTGKGGNDVLYGSNGSDTLYGDAGKDTLYGGADNDTLLGGADADTLDGGKGLDTLYGGSGNDVFVFASGDGVDNVNDFAAGDRIDLQAFNLTGISDPDLTITQQAVGNTTNTVITVGDITIKLLIFSDTLVANDFIF